MNETRIHVKLCEYQLLTSMLLQHKKISAFLCYVVFLDVIMITWL